VLQVLPHSDLPRELVLVTVHARKGTNVRKNVLKGTGMGIDDKLCQATNLSTQVESMPKRDFFRLFVVSILKTNRQYKAVSINKN
jgi:hypothetical protein